MQCVTCKFENMPGSDACGRCGTSLRLATAVMDVQPPRAGIFRKKLRRVLPARKVYYGIRDQAGAVPVPRMPHLPDVVMPSVNWVADVPPWPLTLRMMIPGWSHFYAGKRMRGHLFLWGYLACLLPGLFLMGTQWGAVWIGLAFSVHTSAAFDVMNFSLPRANFGQLMVRSVFVTIYLALAVYTPASWLITRGAAVRVVNLATGPFAAGDVVLVNHWFHGADFPRPGQVVMYEIPPTRVDAPFEQGRGHTIRNFAGEAIDRVLATGGRHVVWKNGRLTIDGVPSDLRPMNLAPYLSGGFDLTVPDDCVFIVPSTVPETNHIAAGDLQRLAVIPKANITGTVYFRLQPFTRIKVIR